MAAWSADVLRVPTGPKRGERFRIDDWQLSFLRDALAPGVREAGLSVSRKNGKSGVIAALLLAYLAGPLNRPEWRAIVCSLTGELAKELRHAIEATAATAGLGVRVPERREAVPFTDAVVAALTAQAGGTGTGDPSAIAALEAAAGLYAAAFAAATVTPANPMTAGLSPACRALIARDLIRRGDSVHRIRIAGGMARLQPIGSWDVRGTADERGWWYRLDEYGPSDNTTDVVPGMAVIHCRYAVDSARPWYGLAPLQWARATGTLAANLELRLGEEAGAPVAHLLPVPPDGGDGGDDDPLANLKTDLGTAKGKSVLVETTAAGFGEGRQAAPMEDWKPRRIGASPPDALPTLRSDAALAVLAACQVPAGLFTDADGTSQREAWRRWAMGPLAGLAATVEAELAAKLDQPVRFDFSGLWAADMAGRASSFKAMVTGGMDPGKAAGLAGLMGGE